MTSRPAATELRLPLVDLGRAFEPLRSAAVATFDRLSGAGAFVLGEDLDAFEREFADYCRTDHCVGVSDGTEALRLGLLALGVGPGDEVVTVPHTFVGTVEAIAATGASIRFVDVDPRTKCMSLPQVSDAIGRDTAAIVPVHLYGRVADIEGIVGVADLTGVQVLEDAAQAHGAMLGGARAGSWGAAGAFSFYPTKNLGALGDGGALVCHDPRTADAVRSLRHHGSAPDSPNRHVRKGATSRLDNLQAAFLRLKLPHLDRWNAERREAARRYRDALAGLAVDLPDTPPSEESHVYHLFVVEVEDRDAVLARLRARGIGAAVHYPTPVHLQPAWRNLGYGPEDFPAAERAAEHTLSLPIFPGITDAEIERVAEALAEVLG